MDLVWFKQDLRIHDNPALFRACEKANDGVVALYLITQQFWKNHHDAAIKIEFWRQNLISLQNDLMKLNIPLLVVTQQSKPAEKVIAEICKKHKVANVFYNKQHEIDEKKRDLQVSEHLKQSKINVFSYNEQMLLPAKQLLNKQNSPYKVFTPFKKAWFQQIDSEKLTVFPKPKKQKLLNICSDKIPKSIPGFSAELNTKKWPVGENKALKLLEKFIAGNIKQYKNNRDFPALDATSTLSPYLTAGVLSIKQCFVATINANHGQLYGGSIHIDTWINELVWREFYRYILIHFPKVCRNQPFIDKTKHLKWREPAKKFEAWKQGITGIPMVDAAMRQLNTTGWMHNRLRMITAMFLTKNLFIDWRLGEKYFMEQLIDGDLASNNGGWQWSASTGTDASPYFRVMNAISQSKRFDPDGEFIRKYCPELKDLDKKFIHEPYNLPKEQFLKLNYPEPIVDLKKSRAEAIEKFKKL